MNDNVNLVVFLLFIAGIVVAIVLAKMDWSGIVHNDRFWLGLYIVGVVVPTVFEVVVIVMAGCDATGWMPIMVGNVMLMTPTGCM